MVVGFSLKRFNFKFRNKILTQQDTVIDIKIPDPPNLDARNSIKNIPNKISIKYA
jgi:hypothetical protein